MNKKYRVGFIQGTFDLFHIGHLNIIKRAKEICEYLIVGVNSDELVEQYKGHKTIIPFDERVEIIRNIRDVDKAIKTSDRDKVKLFQTYHFDCLIMGDDWKGTDFYLSIEKQLEKFNVDVVYLPYTKETSSTMIRKVIQKIYEEDN